MGGALMKRWICSVMLVAFVLTSVLPSSYAQSVLSLPPPGQMVALSPAFNPPVLKGIKVYPDNPLRFDFILDKGDDKSTDEQIKIDSTRLIKYFLASLTIPEKDLWVNLSPYEKDRIVPEAFGQTEMGRDLLAQDYLLKQITASVIYPEGDIGKKFWKKIYALAQEKYGTTDIPVDTFNKVWIVPEKAVVYENGKVGVAYVTESRLKVMLETDYLADEMARRGSIHRAPCNGPDCLEGQITPGAMNGAPTSEVSPVSDFAKSVLREIVIPVLEQEVNEGKNFAKLRQIYQSLILAAWYKKKIKQSLLSAVYVDRKKIDGVNIPDSQEAEKIWGQYVEAFKRGAYNFVKEERDMFTDDVLPRKYFSGGMQMTPSIDYGQVSQLPKNLDNAKVIAVNLEIKKSNESGRLIRIDRAMTGQEIVDSVFVGRALDMHLRERLIEIVERTIIRDPDADVVYKTILELRNIITVDNFEQITQDLFAVVRASGGLKTDSLNQLVRLQESFSPNELKLHWVEIIAITSSSEFSYLFLEALGNLKKEFPGETILYWSQIFGITKDVRYLEYIFKFMIGFKQRINQNFEAVLDDIKVITGRSADSFVLRELSDFIEIVTSENLKEIGFDLIDLRKQSMSLESGHIRIKVWAALQEIKGILSAENLLPIGFNLIEIAKECSEYGYEAEVLETLAGLKHIVTHDNLWQIGKALVEITRKNRVRHTQAPWSEPEQLYQALNDFKEIITSENLNQIGEIFINSDHYRDIRQILLALKSIIKPDNLEQIINDMPFATTSDDGYRKLLAELGHIVTPENLKQVGLDLIEIKKQGVYWVVNDLVSLRDIITSQNLLQVGMDLIEIQKRARQYTYDWALLHCLVRLKSVITAKNLKQVGFDLIDIAKASMGYDKGKNEVESLMELTGQLTEGNYRQVGMALVDVVNASGSNAHDQYEARNAITRFWAKLSPTEMGQYLNNLVSLAKVSRDQISSVFFALSGIYEFIKSEAGNFESHLDLYIKLSGAHNPQNFSKILDVLAQALRTKEISINLDLNDRNKVQRIEDLIDAGFPALSELIQSDETIGELSALAESISSGNFNINDDLHVALNYVNFLNDRNDGVQDARTISYEDFMKRINDIRRGIGTEAGKIKKEYEIEVRGLAYEAHLAREKILELQVKAKSLKRKLVVVENLSYGAVALAPVTLQERGKKFIVGTDIEVWSTKIGSTESHNNEFVMREDLFTVEQLKTLVDEQPLVVVVDGSSSINDRTRTSAHIPDGHKGYINEFIAINQAVLGRVSPKNFYRDDKFVDELQKQRVYIETIDRIKAAVTSGTAATFQAYIFGVWYPGLEDYLYARVGKQKDKILPRIDIANINGPAIIFFQSGIRPEDVPKHVKNDFIIGTHSPVFFDDTAHYTEFVLTFRPNYGLVKSYVYVDFSRRVYRDLCVFLRKDQLSNRASVPGIVDGGSSNQQGTLDDSQDVELPKGGIDLESDRLDLETLNVGSELDFYMDPAQLQQMHDATGFLPVIIGIQPINSLGPFLGLKDKSAAGIQSG